MKCAICPKRLRSGEQVDLHHPRPRSEGGTATVPVHRACHRRHHQERGDFKVWGRQGGLLSALGGRWAFNLRNVRTHPDYHYHRMRASLYG